MVCNGLQRVICARDCFLRLGEHLGVRRRGVVGFDVDVGVGHLRTARLGRFPGGAHGPQGQGTAHAVDGRLQRDAVEEITQSGKASGDERETGFDRTPVHDQSYAFCCAKSAEGPIDQFLRMR